jgi:hypothetical protein
MDLQVRIVRLPDINSQDELTKYRFNAYGRFALLRDESFGFGDLHSSHPTTTQRGWYWAIDIDGSLLISPRGAK